MTSLLVCKICVTILVALKVVLDTEKTSLVSLQMSVYYTIIIIIDFTGTQHDQNKQFSKVNYPINCINPWNALNQMSVMNKLTSS